MKKRESMLLRGIVLAFILCSIIISAGYVSAADEKTSDKAYSCLESQIANKTSFSFQEAVFGVMALGSNKKLTDAITSNKNDKEACWPKGGCKIKDTAQVMVAYDRAGIQTTDIKAWLISKKAVSTELSWYLEVDATQHEPAQCSVKYDGREYKFDIREDMTLSGSYGNCLSLSESGFWLKINNNCLGKSFEVSCNKDFITTTLYQKSSGSTVYVSPKTHSAPSLGITNESVNAKCFKTSGSCDYEGSLWAAFALQKAGEDVSDVLPYLIALADDNEKYFPSSLLYIITSDDEFYSQVIQLRKQGQFWEMGGNGYNRYYDTSMAMLSLGSSAELDATKTYLGSIQTKEGCWNNNNIRDTAFLLYSGWGKALPGKISTGGTALCSEAGFSCEKLMDCLEAGGSKKDNFACSSGGTICCSIKVEKKSCSEEKGKICSASEECDASSFESAEGACCLGECIEIETEPEVNACMDTGGICRSSCEKGEESSAESGCGETEVCCIQGEGSSISWTWIIILILLIALVVLGIMFRDRLRIMWFKYRGRAGSETIKRPTVPPASPPAMARPVQRPVFNMPRQPVRPAPNAKSPKDAEMEETLKKLREMSK